MPLSLFQRNKNAMEEYKFAMELWEPLEQVPMVDVNMEWRAPEMGWFKANWDATLVAQGGTMVCAVVIRDYRGQLVWARCMSCRGYPSPKATEGIATIMAVKLCKELDLTNIHLEGDAKNVVEAINGNEEDRSRDGHVMEELKEEVRSL